MDAWEDVNTGCEDANVDRNVYYVKGNQKNVSYTACVKIVGSFNNVTLDAKPTRTRQSRRAPNNRKSRTYSGGSSTSSGYNSSGRRAPTQAQFFPGEPGFDPWAFIDHPATPAQLRYMAYMYQQQQQQYEGSTAARVPEDSD
ncbi:hypothetical protein D9756_004578 [Leucocoprinus leucothites]|uniref:Uncharacterized protein n=1 Tax=Leucocoprinus leucothites TaxID=201217 RepID=A0A8H5G9D6_9AGAR|nr:hypothetical protein D9756_004578 [Leucoagaricus leucothites]